MLMNSVKLFHIVFLFFGKSKIREEWVKVFGGGILVLVLSRTSPNARTSVTLVPDCKFFVVLIWCHERYPRASGGCFFLSIDSLKILFEI